MGKQRNQKEMYPLVQEYLSSDLSKIVFCRKHGIKVHTFQYWISKFNQEHHNEKQSKFIPLELNKSLGNTNQVIRISYPSGMHLEFPII